VSKPNEGGRGTGAALVRRGDLVGAVD
jgi:hypothetical protein